MTARELPYPPLQFALLRIGLGAFLALLFARLVPFAGELFGPEGLFPKGSETWLPNALRLGFVAERPGMWLGVLAAAAGLFALGVGRRPLAVLLWYGLATLPSRSVAVLNPSLAFVGWLLLAAALVPRGEGTALGRLRPDPAWRLPPILFHGAWLVMALAYTASGWDKLSSAGWVQGQAGAAILGLPFARETALRDALLALPDPLLRIATWGALGTELLFAPLCLLRATRIAVWCAAVALHLGLLVLLDLADISLAMLFIHAFTFDVRWLRPRRGRGQVRAARA